MKLLMNAHRNGMEYSDILLCIVSIVPVTNVIEFHENAMKCRKPMSQTFELLSRKNRSYNFDEIYPLSSPSLDLPNGIQVNVLKKL